MGKGENLDGHVGAWLARDIHSIAPETGVTEPGARECMTLNSLRLVSCTWLLPLRALDTGDLGSQGWVPVPARSLGHSTPAWRGRRRRGSTCVMLSKTLISRNETEIPDPPDRKAEPKPPYKKPAVSPSLENVYLLFPRLGKA